MEARSLEQQLARDHSALLGERLLGGILSSADRHGPTNFAGLLGQHPHGVNEYASLVGIDEEDCVAGGRPRQQPMSRFVSSINRVVPSGVQLGVVDGHLHAGPAPASRAAATQPRPQQLPPADSRAGCSLNRKQQPPQHQQRQPAQQQQQQQHAAPEAAGWGGGAAAPAAAAAAEPQQHPSAAPVPGKPLKIRLKIPRASSDQRLASLSAAQQQQQQSVPPPRDQQQMLQDVRRLGAEPLLSPLPQCWAEALQRSPFEQQPAVGLAAAPAVQQAQQQQGQQEQRRPSAAGAVQAKEVAVAASRVSEQSHGLQQQANPEPAARPQPPPAAAAAGKRPAPAEQAAAHAADASADAAPQAAALASEALAGSGPKRQRLDGQAAAAAAAAAEAATVAAVPPQRQPNASSVTPTEAAEAACPASPPASSAAAATETSGAAAPAASAAAAAEGSHAPQPPVQQYAREHFAAPELPVPASQQANAAGLHLLRTAHQSTTEAAARRAAALAPSSGAAAGGSGGSCDRLSAVATLLPAVLTGAASSAALPASTSVAELQKEGKKLKKFAEKRMKDGKPTHVSSMFLCQSCVKFLEVAATMEAYPPKFSREHTASMFNQTASLLDSCAHNAALAEGPPAITQALSLLAQRLAAVARLRATFCLRVEGGQQAAAFRAALEKGSGETYQRPSPTDSNTSTSISLPLDATGKQQVLPRVQHQQHHQHVGLGGKAASGGGAAAAAAAADGTGPATAASVLLVGMPRSLLERQLLASQHSQAVLQALASFGKSGEKLREYMGQVAAQSNVQGLKAAAATLLLSSDAGMGPAGSILSLAKDALDAIMKM